MTPTVRRGVPWLGALFIAAIVATTAFDIVRDRQVTIEQAGQALDSQARVIAEQTARSIQAVDVVLRHLAEQQRQGVFDALDPAQLHAYLREQAVGLVQADGLLVIDPNGTPRATSKWPVLRDPVPNVSGYPVFRAARERRDAGLLVSTAVVGIDGQWVIPIVRRLETPDGRFAGVVAARGRVEYFQQFYRDVRFEPGTSTSLMHRNGTLIARDPPASDAIGKRFEMFDGMLAAHEAGRRGATRGVSPIDGVDRFAAFQTVPDYPLAVVVTRDTSVALADWRQQALGAALRTSALAALAAVLLALVVRQLSRLESTRCSLEAAQERFQLAVAGSNEGLWDWDMRTDLLFLSARAQTLLGMAPGEPLRPRREWIAMGAYHPDDEWHVRKALSAHLRGRTPHFSSEYRMRHPSGKWHWYRQRGVAVRDERGTPYRVAGSMEDVTERREAQAERERLETQLRQAQKLEAIGTLAGGIAHDFNNILAAILGYGEMAQREAAPGSAQQRHIDAAMSAAQRAKSLVERILAFSRTGVGDRVPVHVQSVVEEALQLVGASLPPGVTLQRELDAGDAALMGDPTQIHQVVMNLCSNAVQAMRGNGLLAVRLDTVTLDATHIVTTSALAPGRYIRLSVRDTGVGIAPGVLERIFDPFFTTKEIGVGTGLGLSLVHGIATDLGGGIEVASEPGHGTTLTVLLPWQGTTAASQSHAAPAPSGDGETVLLVDDEEDLVRMGEEMMAELGYEPVGFASSVAALASFRATPERFSVVVSDESMPELTGSELAREIRRVRPDIPIVLVSGYVTPGLAARARDLGGVEVLGKPLVLGDIARSLANALHR
jgi:PAS domain S-box-containing protein